MLPNFQTVSCNFPHAGPDFLHCAPPDLAWSPETIIVANDTQWKEINFASMKRWRCLCYFHSQTLTLNSRSRCPAKLLNILKSGSLWKYLSYELNAFIMPVVLWLLRATTISPSTIVVSAHSCSTSNPVRSANVPFRHMMRYSFGSMPSALAWSAVEAIKYVTTSWIGWYREYGEKEFNNNNLIRLT